MSKDKAKIRAIEFILAIILVACTLFHFTSHKYFTAALVSIAAIGVSLLLKREQMLKYNKQKVKITMIVFGILYIGLFYMLGIYTGFYRQSNYLSLKTISMYIIPITIIIISSEVLRYKLLLDDSLKSKILTILIGTLIDVSIYLDMYGFQTLDGFLSLVGFVTFAAVANNMLYTYLSVRYGKKVVIIYRLLTTLYIYFIPYTPDVYIYFRTFVRMVYPLLIYSYLEKYFNLDKEKERPKDSKGQAILLGTTCVFLTCVIALISCKFLYGVLVVGSESMTGSIEKGDVIFFKAKKENIKEGDVIVFHKEDLRIVHRVTKVKAVNDEVRYYTKGDANPLPDDDYVTKTNLVGKVLFRIRFIGQPTLWLRNIFDKEG